jgi:hypothetical protein
MKELTCFILLLGSLNLMAETLSSRIHSYDRDYGFIRLENGRVVFFKKHFKSFGTTLTWLSGSKVKVEIDEHNDLVNLSLVESQGEANEGAKRLLQDPPPFNPTILNSIGAAQAMFNRLNSEFKRDSECTDRAHVWAYDEYKTNNIASEKVFAFFTASYIDRNRFKWWFHVAPLVSVNINGSIQKYVLDIRYKDRPTPIKEWTDMMVYSHRDCKMTTRFSEYDVNPQTEDCYMMIDSMYYRLPSDLHLQETLGAYRDQWIESEVRSSRFVGFEQREN